MKFNTLWIVLAIISGIILVIKILTPSVVQVIVESNGNFRVYQVPNVYTFGDVAVMLALMGLFSYAVFKVFFKEKVVLPMKITNEQVVTFLKEDELKVYKIIEQMGPISQTDIAKELGFSRAKVSNIVNILEAYGLVEKKKKGRENIIVITSKEG